MQSHRGLHGRMLGAALALGGACFILVAGAATGATQITRSTGCIPPPPPPDTVYSLKSVTMYDPCSPAAEYDWGVDPPYEGVTYGSEAEAQAAEGSTGTVQVTVTLPTWQSLYDWPNGHGYSGWASATSAPTGAYGMQSALGGQHGLWLWPTGGRQYGPGFSEWAFTAPGTTRISKASVSYAYRNKLLAHHCLKTGLRTASSSTASFEHCKPITPPDSQRDVSISLTDPASNPTSKQLYFSVQFPPCADPSSPGCTKNIAALDPLTTGGYARLKRVDMTLVDDDKPVVTSTGAFFLSEERYDVTVEASDAGAGVKRVELEHIGQGVVASVDTTCDARHVTPTLGSRICPAAQRLQASLDTTSYADGTHEFVARATDLAGNVGEARWKLVIQRLTGTAPGEATGIWFFDPPVTIQSALAWAEQQSVRPVEIVSQFSAPSDTLTTGYFVEPGAPNADVAAEYQDFVYDQFATAAEEGIDNWAAYTNPALVSRLSFAASVGPASLYAFLFREQLRARAVATVGSSRPGAVGFKRTMAACYDPAVAWWPAFGRLTTRQKTSGKYAGKRFVYQDFTYTERRLENMKCFANDPTLELDSNFDDYDRKHYLGGILQHFGYHEFGWKTNMPDAYLDTTFRDEPGERVFTIGTEHARKLVAGKKYYTIIHTEKGNADVDRHLAQAQIGHRDTRYCFVVPDTFCIFADRTAALTPVADKNPWHPVPGTIGWSGGFQRR